MPKLSDLTVEERSALLWMRSRDRRDKSSRLLHIVRREGRDRHKTNYEITNCGQMIRYGDGYYREALPESTDYSFKLCPKCGSREDFAAALAEYHADWKRRTAEMNAEKEAERQAYAAARALRLQVLHVLADAVSPAYTDAQVDDAKCSMTITWQGVKYRVWIEREEGKQP